MLRIDGSTFAHVDAPGAWHLGIGASGRRHRIEIAAIARASASERFVARLRTEDFAIDLPPPSQLRGLSIDVTVDGARTAVASFEERRSRVVIDVDGHVEPSPLDDAHVAFGAFDGQSLALTITGLADIESAHRMRYGVSVRLDAPARLDAIVVDEGWRQLADARLAADFDATLFDAPSRRSDGAHFYALRSTPITPPRSR